MLTKLPERVFTPGVPGTPGRAEYTVCTPTTPPGGAPGGSWQTVCETIVFPPNTSIPIPPGGSVTLISVSPAGIIVSVCSSQWVPNG